jgi:hypothetical protein
VIEGVEIQVSTSESMTTVDQAQVAVDLPHSRCWACGLDLPASKTRPRETCSPACQRRRAFALRKVARRREWMRDWQRFAAAGRVSALEAAKEIATLQGAIEDFSTPLWQSREDAPHEAR